jgi:hypothetical protein
VNSDDFATDAIAVRVGAMDVSEKRSAAEFCANVIARSDDRATTRATTVRQSRDDHATIARRPAQRATILYAKDCNPLLKGL